MKTPSLYTMVVAMFVALAYSAPVSPSAVASPYRLHSGADQTTKTSDATGGLDKRQACGTIDCTFDSGCPDFCSGCNPAGYICSP